MARFFTFFVGLLPYIFVFIASLFPPYYLDLGWHLKYGEYFFQHGHILRENIFSTMMPGYNWANGSWGTDIITYGIFTGGGFLGLTIAGAVVVTLTFFFFAKASRLTSIEKTVFFPILVYLLHPVNSFSFRGQQVSLLLLGILFYILSRYKPSSKILWGVPVLFFFWINLQTESFLGLGVFGLWISFIWIQNFLKKKKVFSKENIFLAKVFVVTVLVTFLNPFGLGIHQIALSHLGDPLLKGVTEYIPFMLFGKLWWNHIVIVLLSVLCVVMLHRQKKLGEYLPVWGIPVLLLILAFDVRRYVWPAYYLILPVLHLLWEPLQQYVKKYVIVIALVLSFISIVYAIQIRMPFSQFTTMSWDAFCKTQNLPCSSQSAEYLRTHGLTDKLFSFYDWGGWLIWNYPDIKPSIDGRMHIWRDENDYSAFAEYNIYMNAQKNIDDSEYDRVYIPMDRSIPLYMQLSELVSQEKWKLIYDDGMVGIVVRTRDK